MSLTSAVENLTNEIVKSTRQRKDCVKSLKSSTSSMITNYNSKRLSDTKENKDLRMQQIIELKNSVNSLMIANLTARKNMSASMRQSLDGFMKGLKSSTVSLLSSYKKERDVLACDILGAKVAWNALLKKK